MSFLERLKNIFTYAVQDIIYHYLLWGTWDQYYSDVLGKAAVHTRVNTQSLEVKAQIRSKTALNSLSFLQNSCVKSNNPDKYKCYLLILTCYTSTAKSVQVLLG